MRRTALRLFAVSLFTLFVPMLLQAATYIVPADAELIRSGDAIGIIQIRSKQSYRTPDGGIATDYTAWVERPLKAMVAGGRTITITQKGGIIGDIGLGVSGEPQFEVGERALVVLRRLHPGHFKTLDGELGKFSFRATAEDRTLVTRGADGDVFGWDASGARHVERWRDAEKFMRYISDVAAGRSPVADYFTDAPRDRVQTNSHVAANDYATLATGGVGIRWQSKGFGTQSTNTTQTGVSDLTGAINTVLGRWNGAGGSGINVSYAGAGASGTYGTPDFANLLFFDQPDSGELAGSTVGQANFWFENINHSYNGASFRNIVDCDVIIQAGMTGNLFEAVLGHELGHCLGFRHSNQPGSGQTVSTTDALMNSSSSGNANLRQYDQDAASHMYGDGGGPPCTPPAINNHPGSVTITQGNATTLTVVAAGTNLVYQWYIGNSGNTSQPTGTNSASLQVSPTTTTSYWVRVSGQCGTPLDSNTATVTVNPPACVAPSIQTHPGSITINEGTGTTLSVSATGTAPLFYQWFIGTSGVTTTPTGTNSASLFVNPSTTTSYWVRVDGNCGSPANSNTATVTVNPAPCVPPQITTPPQSITIAAGQNTTLFVAATGSSLTYQWFIGATGDTSQPTGTNNAQLNVAPSVTTQYWVRITGACGSPALSGTATVTVFTCPDVTVQTPVATKQLNGSYILTVEAESGGRALTRSWFRGSTPGSGGTFLGNGNSMPVPAPTGPTSYWARVENDCAKSAVSPLVTINTCELATITTQPQDRSIASGTSTTLTVAFTPTAGATVTWYRGTAPNKTNQVGTGASFNTGALTTTTSFFASITNSCGEVFTRTVTVSISCTAPTLTQPANQTVNKGKSATITVTTAGSGPFSYQWYEGALGVTLFPVGTNSATLVTAPIQNATQFWVLVRNACGEAFSQPVQVKVGTPKRRSTRHP